ncbi:hypothetical protein FVE85_5658 [Porphyridium purpureum]|uniref:Uncharacterized protein n=1 Tax=Porphyridium purpureum TaxID=35688 RepID=A0A5J4Z5F4_PORPP|nr:hypothetical protein FVE85_5658 [Porphyridium purpureum]|eukprot:POR8121..scf295_1
MEESRAMKEARQRLREKIVALDVIEQDVLGLLGSAASAVDVLAKMDPVGDTQTKFNGFAQDFLATLAAIQAQLAQHVMRIQPNLPVANTNTRTLLMGDLALQKVFRAHEMISAICAKHEAYLPPLEERATLAPLPALTKATYTTDRLRDAQLERRAQAEQAITAANKPASTSLGALRNGNVQDGTDSARLDSAMHTVAAESPGPEGIAGRGDGSTGKEVSGKDSTAPASRNAKDEQTTEQEGAEDKAAQPTDSAAPGAGEDGQEQKKAPASSAAGDATPGSNQLIGMEDVEFDFALGEMELDF